ncbi:MAG: hypothetical protein RL334_895 [Chloroflexota bacterium]
MLNLPRIRANFPALSLQDAGQPRIYLDNPGGTQVAQQVLDRMQHYLVHNNANHGGAFRTSRDSDVIQAEAHSAMADILNAASPAEIIFGQNMTSLTFAMSRSLAQGWQAGDELIVTRLDHDGNIAPWLAVAAERGMTVKWLEVDVEDCTLQTEQLQQLLTPRTRLVAVGYASNAVGTVNPIVQIAAQVHAAGALLFVDAVQWVAHGPTNVQALGADLLACSAYKFFGPHQGVLWGRQALLEQLPAYKVRPASDELPGKFETGTQSHEGLAGVLGAVDYFEWVGAHEGGAHAAQFKQLAGRRQTLACGLAAIQAYERTLSQQCASTASQMRSSLQSAWRRCHLRWRAIRRGRWRRRWVHKIFLCGTAITMQWKLWSVLGWRIAAAWCAWARCTTTPRRRSGAYCRRLKIWLQPANSRLLAA